MYKVEKSVSMLNNSNFVDFRKLYSSGKRQFHKAQLERAFLEKHSLSQADLREADLNYANLKNADLSDTDLRESSLIRTELSGANLSRANLASADLSRANLAIANLQGANLTGACLNKACLTAANLDKVDLRYANLTGTYLIGVDLSQANLNGALYDDDTDFPPDFDPINAGMLQNYTLEQLLAQFNHLCECSNHYLGVIMTAKYLYSSRPEFGWLNKFEINKFNQITFEGIVTDSLSHNQLLWFQKWMQSFIQSCSQIIKNFSQLI